jgi:hypothetical protein
MRVEPSGNEKGCGISLAGSLRYRAPACKLLGMERGSHRYEP